MLTSLALIFLVGIFLGEVLKKINLPSLLGMMATGMLLGPYVLNLIDESILSISTDLRQLALIIILIRAGLSLDIKALRNVGRSAILMCFIPACFEILGMILLAPKLLDISVLDAAIMGSVIAAVSPAVIVPRMIALMENKYGTDKSIPQLIMAGASVDDVFVIVLFASFTSLSSGGNISFASFAKIPFSILTGIVVGFALGWLISVFFKHIHTRDSVKVIILLSIALLLIAFENGVEGIIPFSGLIAVMVIGIAILHTYPILAGRLSSKFSKLWVVAEILLFVLVGATIDLSYAVSAGVNTILLLFSVIIFRVIGVFVCLLGTKLNMKERAFCMIAYTPKATVQAAIGGIPLAMGLPCGKIVLTVAVLGIIITAPLGAFGIDLTYKRFLTRTDEKIEDESITS